jgi:hypothetical protein
VLSAEAGLHRFVWDLHYPRPAVLRFRYPISAVAGNTPVTPFGPWVLPGRYTVKLTANGKTYSQMLTVKMDPRVQTSSAEIERQHRLSMKLYDLLQQDFDALTDVRAFRADHRNSARENEAAALERNLTRLNGNLGSLLSTIERADVTPTSQVVQAIEAVERELNATLAEWQALRR